MRDQIHCPTAVDLVLYELAMEFGVRWKTLNDVNRHPISLVR